MNEKILIIIPAYNEEASILKTCKEIYEYNSKYKTNYDILVINDCSTDSTLKICKGNDIPVISLVHNLGIGGAVQTGYKYAYEYNYDIAIQYDGDGQHNIEYAKNIIDPIINEKSDFVIGSRFVTENASEFKSSAARRIGIKIISSTLHLITKKIIKMFAQDYPVEYPEPLTNMDLILKGYNVKEVPVAMREREGGVSSIRAWKNAYYMINVILSLLVFGLRGKRKNG